MFWVLVNRYRNTAQGLYHTAVAEKFYKKQSFNEQNAYLLCCEYNGIQHPLHIHFFYKQIEMCQGNTGQILSH